MTDAPSQDRVEELTILACPFCGWRADGALRTFDGHTLRHDGQGCVLTGLWFRVELWNKRVSESESVTVTRAELKMAMLAFKRIEQGPGTSKAMREIASARAEQIALRLGE